MATEVRQRYRRLDAFRCAAAYADDRGGILAANDAFHDLWCWCGGGTGPVEGRMLFTLFAGDDRQDVRDIVAVPKGAPRPLSRVARLAGTPATTIAEFVPIRRSSRPRELIWLVVLGSTDGACQFHFRPPPRES